MFATLIVFLVHWFVRAWSSSDQGVKNLSPDPASLPPSPPSRAACAWRGIGPHWRCGVDDEDLCPEEFDFDVYVNCLYQSWARASSLAMTSPRTGSTRYEKLLHMAMSALGLLVCAVVIGATTANVARHFAEADRFALEGRRSQSTGSRTSTRPVDHHKRAGPAHWTPVPATAAAKTAAAARRVAGSVAGRVQESSQAHLKVSRADALSSMKLCLRSSFLRLLRYHHQLWERHKLLPSGDGSDHFSALNESLRHDVKRALRGHAPRHPDVRDAAQPQPDGLLPHLIDRIVPRYG